MNYYLMPGSIFVPYRFRHLFCRDALANGRAVVIGRGFDERIIGWFIKVT